MKMNLKTAVGLFTLLMLQPVLGKSLEESTSSGLRVAPFAEAEKVTTGNTRHEFYVGLTDIVYNPATRTFEITIKVFTDDLELALGRANGGKAVTLADYGAEAGNDSLIFAYLAGRFSFSRKGEETITTHPVGRETELDVTWIYLETDPMQPLKEAVVSNTMMMELYDDQTHIVHLKQGGVTKSILLHRGKRSGTLKP